MDSANKDEAKRCLQYAQKALREGDSAKARRLAEKSLRLCRSSEADALLDQLSQRDHSTGAGSAGVEEGTAASGDDVRGEGARQRRAREADESVDYTPEQQEAVEKVLGCHDYYEILGVSRDAEDADLKKQYRRLALQLHPDKNRAPRADEAFKAVSKAYAVLSDTEKREQYDRFGEEGLRPSSFGRGFEPDVSPDDIFRMFFGNSFSMDGDAYFYSNGPSSQYYVYRPSRHRHAHHHGHHHGHRQQAGSTWLQVCQVMPIVVLVLVSVFSNVLFSSLLPPPFALRKTNEYHVKRVTEQHNLPYYVTESFSQEYSSLNGVRGVEREVVEAWRWELQGQCQRERYRANRKGKGKEEPQSCKKLRQLLAAG